MNGCSCKSHKFCSLVLGLGSLVFGFAKTKIPRPKTLFIKNPLASISLGAVGEECDYSFPWSKSFRDFVRRRSSGARRPTAEKPLEFRNPFERIANLFVVHHHDLVCERRVVNLGDEIPLSDAFDLLWSRRFASVNRSFGLYQNTKRFRVLFFHGPRNTAERTRRSRADHDGVNPAVHLLDNFARCGQFMKTRVRIILKLLRHTAAFDGARQLATAIDRAFHACLVRNVFNLTAERFDQFHFLLRESARDAENNTVTTRNSHQREPDACVSGGWLDDRRAGLE